MPKDNFDNLIDDELREAKKPKPMAPPPGMVGTAPARSAPIEKPTRKPLLPPTPPAAARWFHGLGWVNIAVGVFAALYLSEGMAESFLWLFSGIAAGMAFLGVAIAIDRINATAHYTQKMAEKMHEH